MEADNKVEVEKGWLNRWLCHLETRWNSLPPVQQRVGMTVFIALLESFLAYCCWVAETRGQSALVIHIGIFRVMAVTGIFAGALLNAPVLSFLLNKAGAFGNRVKSPLRQSANRLTSHVPLLTQAHGYYTVGCDVEARHLAEQVLAREPENVTAQELLQLIEARQAQRKLEPEAKPGLTDKVLDGITEKLEKSEYTPAVLIVLVVATAILSLIQCLRYAYIGVTQGWNMTAWSGVNRAGEWQYHSIGEAALLFAIWPTLISLLLLHIYFPKRMDKLLNTGVTICLAMYDWGKSRPSAIRNFVSRTVRSTPSRSSEPKASPASRPSSTTRTRPRR